MVAAAGPATTKATWADWRPGEPPQPDEVLTRDELLDRLATEGVTVSVDDLQNWQRAGVVPYGIRRWHRGATRMLYPPWMVDLLRHLRVQQQAGRGSATSPTSCACSRTPGFHRQVPQPCQPA